MLIATFILCTFIAILWVVVYYNHLPMFDKITKHYVMDEHGIGIANLCIFLMLILSFILGKLI